MTNSDLTNHLHRTVTHTVTVAFSDGSTFVTIVDEHRFAELVRDGRVIREHAA